MGESQLLGFRGKFSESSPMSVKNFPGFRLGGEIYASMVHPPTFDGDVAQLV